MSKTIRRNWEVDGVPTNPTSIKLQDPTNTFGVKRNDTSAVVVAAGTSLEEVETGVFEYTFEEPTTGLAYTAYVQVVYAGNTFYFEHDIPATTYNPYRTTAELIRLIAAIPSTVNLTGFILTANLLVNKITECYDDEMLELIERYLAAHFYLSVMEGGQVTSESEIGASVSRSFAGGEGLKATQAGQMVLVLDTEGCLAKLTNGNRTQFMWLGTEN